LKISLQADANLNPIIWRVLHRREPSIDFRGFVGVIADGTTDDDVLRLAALENRVLVTGDVRTMPEHLRRFKAESSFPGVILVPLSRPLDIVIEGLLPMWINWSAEWIRDQAVWDPIPRRPR